MQAYFIFNPVRQSSTAVLKRARRWGAGAPRFRTMTAIKPTQARSDNSVRPTRTEQALSLDEAGAAHRYNQQGPRRDVVRRDEERPLTIRKRAEVIADE